MPTAKHRHTVLVAAYLSVIYAVAFVVYLSKLHGEKIGVRA